MGIFQREVRRGKLLKERHGLWNMKENVAKCMPVVVNQFNYSVKKSDNSYETFLNIDLLFDKKLIFDRKSQHILVDNHDNIRVEKDREAFPMRFRRIGNSLHA